VIKAFFAIRDRHSVLGTYSIDRYGDTSLSHFAGNKVRGTRLVLDKVLEVRPEHQCRAATRPCCAM